MPVPETIVYKYCYFPLYDTKKNSFVRRYQLWMKYRDYCKKNGRKFVDVNSFSKIIGVTQKIAARYMIEDPEGVNFFKFKLKVALVKIRVKRNFFFVIDKAYLPVVKVETTYKKKVKFRVNYWNFFMEHRMKVKVMNHLKDNPDMFNYEILTHYKVKNDENFFNDF